MEPDAVNQQSENSEASQSAVRGPDSDNESCMEQDTAPPHSTDTGTSQATCANNKFPRRRHK